MRNLSELLGSIRQAGRDRVDGKATGALLGNNDFSLATQIANR
jgi:hypothetical protein